MRRNSNHFCGRTVQHHCRVMVALMAAFAPTIADSEYLTTVRLLTLSNRNVDVAADANGSVETDMTRKRESWVMLNGLNRATLLMPVQR
jgi:hypothetical protein